MKLVIDLSQNTSFVQKLSDEEDFLFNVSSDLSSYAESSNYQKEESIKSKLLSIGLTDEEISRILR